MVLQTPSSVRFPTARMRRLRSSGLLRDMVRETTLDSRDFIYPIFVTHGRGVEDAIASMPGVSRLSVDKLAAQGRELLSLGIPAVLLFGLPEAKDEVGSGAYDPDGIVQRAVRELKNAVPELLVVTDVCLCEYTSHGHCGVIRNGDVDNDESLELLAQTSLSHATAGADIVAPSDMMDGRVSAIRATLDAEGRTNVPIMAYSAKYASAFYGPFREAADSTPQFGDRRSYQMDPANVREALREVQLDIEEGADIVIVKPAMAYLDVIARVRERFSLPIATYNVSGEYAMVKAAAQNGWIDEQRVVLELLTGMRRAGADMIITYHAKDASRWLRQ
ncbi:MAG: porphobilinogen synthase [Dehalococcoidia bacterium]|nr:porphobilinogen synthase [Dehalococcoidia bacterium]